MSELSVAHRISPYRCETDKVSVGIYTDPAGRTETPPLPNPRIAIHLGRSVYMACQRGGQKHGGWAVHGDIDIVPAGTGCVWEPDGPDTALIVGLHGGLIKTVAEELGLPADRLEVLNRFQVRDSQIEHICWALKAEMDLGFPGGRILRDSLSTSLATALACRHSSLAPAPFRSKETMSGHRLRQALSFVEENLKRDLSLSEIAQAAGVSVSHFKATFRQMTGVPVHQYLIQRRVERARTLLSDGKLSISEVAAETGFAHQSHLAKHMRRILGCSPKEIRSLRS
jgi:AraC family transcriptional regulator